jgi:TetR/AcrR family transcriptional regulator, transcriptional repressor of aconitase
VPKVSDSYRDARRAHILDAARRAFLRNGFHATSMQDLFAEAELSSGAVYRYFAGKDEVVLAIAQDNIREVGAMIRAVTEERSGDSIGVALAAAVELIQAKNQQTGLAGIGVQAWAEALRNPKIGVAFGEMLSTLRAQVAEVIMHHQTTGAIPAQPTAQSLASVMIGILMGHIAQLVLLGDDALTDVPDALRALWPPSPDQP